MTIPKADFMHYMQSWKTSIPEVMFSILTNEKMMTSNICRIPISRQEPTWVKP